VDVNESEMNGLLYELLLEKRVNGKRECSSRTNLIEEDEEEGRWRKVEESKLFVDG
jgi:hypothetical protein